MIAERLTTERSRDYMNARRVAKEYEAITRGLNKVAPSVPPTGNQNDILSKIYFSFEHHISDVCLREVTTFDLCFYSLNCGKIIDF